MTKGLTSSRRATRLSSRGPLPHHLHLRHRACSPSSRPFSRPVAPPQYAPPAQPQPAYGQPQPQPGYPPAQPPGPQPAYGQPPPQQPPAKKGKGGIIALVIALVMLCGLVSCGVLGYSLFKSSASDTAAIQQAETHLDAAVTSVEVATASLESLNQGSPSTTEINAIVVKTDSQLKTARDEIASARAIAEQWKDSQGKTDYLAALAASTETLDALQDLVAYVDTASGMLGKATQAGKATAAGNSALNAAVQAGNKSKYSTMRNKAQSAQANYVKAALLFREAHKLDKSAGLDKAAKYADLRKKQADVVVRMAAAGQARRYSAYNADIKKMNSYSKAAEKVGTPAIAKDENWAEKRLADLEKVITEASEKADSLRKQALTELGYTK